MLILIFKKTFYYIKILQKYLKFQFLINISILNLMIATKSLFIDNIKVNFFKNSWYIN